MRRCLRNGLPRVFVWVTPQRSQHNALDALSTGLLTKKVNWVLDLDIRGFFDAISHEWLVKFIEHRIADRRVVRLIQKWLNGRRAGGWKRVRMEEGTPRAGSAGRRCWRISICITSSICGLRQGVESQAHGDVIVVRYADDIVVGFQMKRNAKRFLPNLPERVSEVHLELHPDKRGLLEFGHSRPVTGSGAEKGKPETFDSSLHA